MSLLIILCDTSLIKFLQKGKTVQVNYDIAHPNPADNKIMILITYFRWERHTRIKRGLGASGSLRGEVLYIAPCSKKLRTYNDLQKVTFVVRSLLSKHC